MKKLVVALIVIFIVAVVAVYLENSNDTGTKTEKIAAYPTPEFIQCLADAGMIIYGSATCPACQDLVSQFGGYDEVKPLYVECADFADRCSEEMQTSYVPEIQMNGEVFEGQVTMEDFASETGCEL